MQLPNAGNSKLRQECNIAALSEFVGKTKYQMESIEFEILPLGIQASRKEIPSSGLYPHFRLRRQYRHLAQSNIAVYLDSSDSFIAFSSDL